MLFETPSVKPDTQRKLDELDRLRRTLGHEVNRPTRWMGALRRSVRASSIESSTSIEGYRVAPEDAVALVRPGESSVSPADENEMAVACYARAIDHVSVLSRDPAFRWLDRVILDLHFDACYFQPEKSPGLWRTDPVSVTADDGSLEFRGPDAEQVPGLMAEVIDWLDNGDLEQNVVVRAAMAHLHVVSAHPFRDGNGRTARIVQSLVLAREGLVSTEFSSIEEYLGQNTPAYYAILRETQGGSYQPRRDASAWIDFCVDAHLAQARQRLTQIEQAAARWQRLERMVDERGWPDRLVIALEQSLIGGTDRARYGEEAGVSTATASADLRRLLDNGLVEQAGKGPRTRYQASGQLRSDTAE